MGYRVKTGRALKRIAPQGLSAVQSAIRARDDGVALAMSFDPGTVSDIALNSHAIDILMGLLYVRGWAQAQQDMLIAMAQDWTDRWWERTLGPGAFVVETALRPADARCEVDDITRIASLAALAWCMELDVCERERPTPDLMLAAAVPEGLSLASVHNEPWTDALRESLGAVMQRMSEQTEGHGSRSHTYVEMHLKGSSVQPWSLPDRSCVFGTTITDPHWKRTYIALRDTAEDPNSETTRSLLRLMLASGADD